MIKNIAVLVLALTLTGCCFMGKKSEESTSAGEEQAQTDIETESGAESEEATETH